VKANILLALTALCVSSSYAQPQENWSRVYRGNEYRAAWAHCKTLDGGYALACETGDNRDNIYDFLLIKVDAEGEIEWERRAGTQANETPRGIVQCDDGGFIVAGYNQGGARADIYEVKINRDGELVWQQAIGRDQNEYGMAVVDGIEEGCYVIAGRSDSFGNASDGYVVKIDDDGEVMWERNYDFEGQFDMFTSLVAIRDGYVLCGEGGANRRRILVKIDDDGEVVWSHSYENPNGILHKAWDLAITEDGGFIIAGHANLRPGSDGFLMKTDLNGELAWSCRYRGIRNTEAFSVATVPNVGYALCGQTDGRFWRLWVDNRGEIIDEQVINGLGWSVEADADNVTFAGTDGFSALFSKYTYQELPELLRLTRGWDLYSCPVVPAEADIPQLFSPLVQRDNLMLIKDQNGRFYFPALNFCNLPEWDVHQGYLIRMASSDSLVIDGELLPENEPIMLRQGWNMIAYYPEAQLEAPEAFASIEDILIIAKDGSGHFYLPGQNFNNLPILHRWAGYLIRVSRDCEFRWVE